MPDELRDGFRAERGAIDAALAAMCDRELADVDARVRDAIRYGLLGEGKRLRGLLVLAAYEAAGGRHDAAPLAAAVEVVHAYSLIHDDLPCMDDDDLRRGRPTVHRVFGVPVATAAGVAMVPLAAGTAYRAALAVHASLERAGTIVRELMLASSAGGMVGGQWLDLQAEGRRIPLEELERVHRAKTGLLIVASTRIGALAAGCSGDELDAFTRYGDALGLAFQIADDVLDVTATSDQLGKTAGRDAALGKSTYPLLLGVEGARTRARRLATEACDALRPLGRLTPQLERLAVHVVERQS
ncbi:MAG TPA: polyprenyl synthetase family protein [Gemmatimonadaceae bacterium]|nr:polyprenyl synthetase family protein [Gemmatimonadaceae bacterium]